MSWVDLLILAVPLLSAVVGLLRGLVRETLGLCAWVAAALLANALYRPLLPTARRLVGDAAVADPVAFVVVFAVLLIAFLLVAQALGALVRGSLLGGLDRLAGAAFGLARGFAVLAIAYLLAVPVFPPQGWPAPLRDSRSLPYIRHGAALVSDWLPARVRSALRPAPSAAGDTA